MLSWDDQSQPAAPRALHPFPASGSAMNTEAPASPAPTSHRRMNATFRLIGALTGSSALTGQPVVTVRCSSARRLADLALRGIRQK